MKAEQTVKPVKNKVIQQKAETKGKTLPAESSLKSPGFSLINGDSGGKDTTKSPQFGVKQLQSAPSITPTLFSNLPIQRVGVELRGAQTLGAKFNAFFLGKESTYTLLQKKYKEYLKGNTELKGECIKLANKWLIDHGSSKDPNDIIKHESIDELLRSLNRNNIQEQPADEFLPEPSPVPGPNPVPGPDPIAVKEDDPIEEPKIEYKSNIDAIEILHNEYKLLKKDNFSLTELIVIFNKLSDFVHELKIWDSNFSKEDNLNFKSENEKIIEFRKILLDNYNYDSDFFSGTISELNIEALLNRTFTASSMNVTVQLPNGPIELDIQEITISHGGFEFNEFSIKYSSSIGFAEIFSINKSELIISSNATGFEITASGELAANLGIGLEVSGTAEITYNSEERAFKKPEITSGAFKYKPAIGFKHLVSVENLSGELNVVGEEYKVEGSGDLSVDFGNGSNVKLTAKVVYDDGFKIESITDGGFNISALEGLIDINGSGLNYDDEGLKIQSSTIKLNTAEYIPGVNNIKATGEEIEYIDGIFDWNTIKLDINKKFSFSGMTFSLGAATLYGKSEGYIIKIENEGIKVVNDKVLDFKNIFWDPTVEL
jgi:hypothetical protein